MRLLKPLTFLFLFHAVIVGQINVSADSTAISDTLFADSANVISDSLATPDSLAKDNNDIDAVVFASGTDSLIFNVTEKRMYIYRDGEVTYKNSELKSGLIVSDFTTNEMIADGIADTSDSTKNGLIQTPSLAEGDEVYEGKSLRYNFKTQRGFISMAKNTEESSSYRGEKVKKVDRDTYFIEDGIYTTCDADTPHTHFQASEMKVIQKDKIVAKWIFMYIAGVPLPIPLPFAVFPNETGRRSGFIIPSYGQDAARGFYFRNFGYFFALSDYYDYTLTGDYYLKGGYGINNRFRYKKRYSFDGELIANYANQTVGEEGDPGRSEQENYKLYFRHNQTFNPTSSMNINLTFQSNNYQRNTAVTYDEILQQTITSNATYSKRFENIGGNLTASYSRTQYLNNGNITETLPRISFSLAQFYPFRGKDYKPSDQSWYEYIGMNYSTQFLNRRNKTDGQLKINGGFNHDINISAQPKIGYFTISPSISYNEKWYNKYQTRHTEIVPVEVPVVNNGDTSYVTRYQENVVTDEHHKLSFVRSFGFNLSASTKIYGMAQPQMLGVEAFRHTISPSVSYNYRPDFSKDMWGYYDEYVDSSGNVVRYDKYSGQVFGGAGSGESQSINLSIGNLFEMKTMKDPTDTTSTQDKIKLLSLSLSTGYNFAADSLRLSDLRVSYNTSIGEWLNLNGSSNYTFYDFAGGRKINEYLAAKGKGLFRITSFNLSLSTSLSGDKIAGETRTGEDEEEEDQAYNYVIGNEEIKPNFAIPWNLSLYYSYNFSKPTPDNWTESQGIGMNFSVSLTENWKISGNANYDFKRHEIASPSISIYRDLHCWEMNLRWNPIGTYRGFNFEIRMKAPQLSDIKVTRNQGLYTGR